MYTPEQHEQFEQMVADSWAGTSATAVAAARLAEMLQSAEAGGIEWAKFRLHEALLGGTAKMCKAYRKLRVETSRGPIALTAGVLSATANEFVQLRLVDLTADQIDQALATRDKQLKAASRNARVLRSAKKLMSKHPSASTLGAALVAEGITLAEMIAA